MLIRRVLIAIALIASIASDGEKPAQADPPKAEKKKEKKKADTQCPAGTTPKGGQCVSTTTTDGSGKD